MAQLMMESMKAVDFTSMESWESTLTLSQQKTLYSLRAELMEELWAEPLETVLLALRFEDLEEGEEAELLAALEAAEDAKLEVIDRRAKRGEWAAQYLLGVHYSELNEPMEARTWIQKACEQLGRQCPEMQ